MSLLPSYTHIINPKLKYIYLSFDTKGELCIKSPKVSQKEIERILLKKALWITKTKEKLSKKKGKALNFELQNELYFLGKAYPLILVPYEKKYTKLIFNEDTFFLYYSVYDTDIFQKHIDMFYKKEALHYVPKCLNIWAINMQLTYQKVSFRKTKRQWGSCSSKNNISFNTLIMKLPKDVIEYIVVHELAHIQHKHHQRSFWDLVGKTLPHYKTSIQILKNFTI